MSIDDPYFVGGTANNIKRSNAHKVRPSQSLDHERPIQHCKSSQFINKSYFFKYICMYVFYFSIHLCCTPAHPTTKAETTNSQTFLIQSDCFEETRTKFFKFLKIHDSLGIGCWIRIRFIRFSRMKM